MILEEKLTLALLGSVQITIGEKPIASLSTRAQAVLVYLAMEQKTVSRLNLASLIWPDISEGRALTNLRKVVLEFRQQIPEFTDITRQTLNIRIPENSEVCVDAREFEECVTSLPIGTPNTALLRQALCLYKGQFLANFDLAASSEYSNWQARVGERLAQHAIYCCDALIRRYEEDGNLLKAIHYARRLLDIQPWREEAHRLLMQLFVENGQRTAALKQFDICEQILSSEFGVSPCEETQQLYGKIRDTGVKLETVTDHTKKRTTESLNYYPAKKSRFIVGPPVKETHRFFGRATEIAFVARAWENLPLSAIALVGVRRCGKTSLLAHIQALMNPQAHVFRPRQRSDWLDALPTGRAVPVDFQDPRMRNRSRLLQHLLHGIGRESPDSCSLEQFMDIALEEPLKFPVYIFLDELSAALASDELDQSFWWCMRSFAQASDGLLGFLVASHQTPMLEAAAADKASPFFNLFSTVEISSLLIGEARELLSQAQPPMSEEDMEWIITHSNCWPALLQAFAREYELSGIANATTAQWRQAAQKRVELMGGMVSPHKLRKKQ